MKGPDFARL